MTTAPAVNTWTSREVRDQLAQLLRRDLLGPWDGEQEILDAKVGPRDRYLTGILAPLDAGSEDLGVDEDLDTGEFGDESDDRPAAGVAATRLFPSSMGLTCAVVPETESVTVTASWGRYERFAPKDEPASDDTAAPTLQINDDAPKNQRRPWRRNPIASTIPDCPGACPECLVALDHSARGPRPQGGDIFPD